MSLATATRNGGVAFVKIAACDEHEVLSSGSLSKTPSALRPGAGLMDLMLTC